MLIGFAQSESHGDLPQKNSDITTLADSATLGNLGFLEISQANAVDKIARLTGWPSKLSIFAFNSTAIWMYKSFQAAFALKGGLHEDSQRHPGG
jgi:hypothetical protein